VEYTATAGEASSGIPLSKEDAMMENGPTQTR
jgi:hypothetical protein